ncbi:MAG: hypothetical protein M5U31_07440 [Acidimicrobiia bacterium]|nr:hypothetical protein [Acidimicrobiia bacterium]
MSTADLADVAVRGVGGHDRRELALGDRLEQDREVRIARPEDGRRVEDDGVEALLDSGEHLVLGQPLRAVVVDGRDQCLGGQAFVEGLVLVAVCRAARGVDEASRAGLERGGHQ